MMTTETNPCVAKTLCRAGRKYSALEQCRALLLVWSERRTPAEVSRELKISGGLLALWQERALEGMLTALEPREGARGPEQGPALCGRVKKMLEKKTAEREGLARMHGRLARLHNKLSPAASPPVTEG